MSVNTVGHEPGFSIWIARLPEPDGPYGIRFEMTEGKGVLRVARPGVLIEPPARALGTEFRLTAAQIQSSRFQHVWGRGAFRQTHVLHRIGLEELGLLPIGHWVEMAAEVEGGVHCLIVPEQDVPEEDEPLPLGEADGEDLEADGTVMADMFVSEADEEDGGDEEFDIEQVESDPETPGPTLVPFGESRTGLTARPVQPRPAPGRGHGATDAGREDPYVLIEQLKGKLDEARRKNVEMERQMAILKARLEVMEGKRLAEDWGLPEEYEPGGPTQKMVPGWRPTSRRR